MEKRTVLVASRHPHLEDVRRHVLEQAGYHVLTIREPEELLEICKNRRIDLAVIGYSITTEEKERIANEIVASCHCLILELWDRRPPQRRAYPVFDHFSLTPEDFLDKVTSLLGGQKAC
jgi:hypothetical protein